MTRVGGRKLLNLKPQLDASWHITSIVATPAFHLQGYQDDRFNDLAIDKRSATGAIAFAED